MQHSRRAWASHPLLDLSLVISVSGTSNHTGSLAFHTLSEVRGLYDYHSQGPDELDVSEGARIELTSGPSGGQNYAEGWWEGRLEHTARFESFHTNQKAFLRC